MKLGSKNIGISERPYVIAEMSGNHNQSLEKALAIVEAAAKSGVDALKIQTYTPDTMTLDISKGEFVIEDKNSLWAGKSLYKLYGEAMTPWEWHRPIMERCKKLNIDFFSSPFDATAVDFLEELGVEFYKIASFELNDIPLIKKVAKTGKPIIMSTGMATISEISEALEAARTNGCKEIVLLKCTSAYPADPKNANLMSIKSMREVFGVEVGLSDHTMGIAVPVASVVLGASVIEKHFTINRTEGGVDSAFSMEPHEFLEMIKEINRAKDALGSVHFGLTESEIKSRVFRRSIYITKDVKKGEVFDESNLRVIRPSLGLEPKFFERVIGLKAKEDYPKGTPLGWDKIS
jgi:pseudaminic acid synthase